MTHFPSLPPIDLQQVAMEQALISTPVTIGPTPSNVVAIRSTAAVASATANQLLPLANNATLVDAFIVIAIRSTGVDNSADIFIGNGGGQLFRLRPGAIYQEQAPAGKKLDLNQVVIRVPTIGDGVVWQGVT